MNYLQEFSKRFSRDGALRVKLNQLRSLQNKYPDSDFLKSLIRAQRKQIYGVKGKGFMAREIFGLLERYYGKQGVLEIDALRFAIEEADRAVFSETYIDCFVADKQFVAKSGVSQEIIEILSIFEGEGPYQTDHLMLSPGDVVVDAGANLGIFSLLAARYCGAHCYAFEPSSSVVTKLSNHILLNDLSSQISICRYALGRETASMYLSMDSTNVGGATMISERALESALVEEVRCVALDEWVKENNISKIDFIKADIEGAERLLLAGAQQILKTMAPKLSICTYHLPDDPEVLEQLILAANPSYKIVHGEKKLYARV